MKQEQALLTRLAGYCDTKLGREAVVSRLPTAPEVYTVVRLWTVLQFYQLKLPMIVRM